jgi:hypothetical protein
MIESKKHFGPSIPLKDAKELGLTKSGKSESSGMPKAAGTVMDDAADEANDTGYGKHEPETLSVHREDNGYYTLVLQFRDWDSTISCLNHLLDGQHEEDEDWQDAS